MATGQVGILALGDAAHGFFEFTLREGADPATLVKIVADLEPPHTTVGGVNLVVGFRPDLWRRVVPGGIPDDVHGFDAPVRGPDGFAHPATQADLFVWYGAAAYDIVFDLGGATRAALSPVATLTREVTGWSYKHSRDLTGFEDGTENPTLYEAPAIAFIADGPAAGGSVLLFQVWRHDHDRWVALAEEAQEKIMGRTKAESVELPENVMPRDAHVARTKFVVDGEERHIFRRNMPYGNVTEHGTLFIGFAAEQRRMHAMLEQMAGADGGPRDALTRYSTPLTGAYYFVPSVEAMGAFATPKDDD